MGTSCPAWNRNPAHLLDNSYATGPPEPATGPGRGKYSENGRLYQDWHKGQYLFPVDEVRTRFPPASSWGLPPFLLPGV